MTARRRRPGKRQDEMRLPRRNPRRQIDGNGLCERRLVVMLDYVYENARLEIFGEGQEGDKRKIDWKIHL